MVGVCSAPGAVTNLVAASVQSDSEATVSQLATVLFNFPQSGAIQGRIVGAKWQFRFATCPFVQLVVRACDVNVPKGRSGINPLQTQNRSFEARRSRSASASNREA